MPPTSAKERLPHRQAAGSKLGKKDLRHTTRTHGELSGERGGLQPLAVDMSVQYVMRRYKEISERLGGVEFAAVPRAQELFAKGGAAQRIASACGLRSFYITWINAKEPKAN
ncbi:hypothetical protein SCAR479_06036 [Seiridium cardinale]|uniref:Uncharacterized protein n=1 Tax=Seiridium cardinale TaxID=138064 RepID=A0ABR2XUD2_9PEZI